MLSLDSALGIQLEIDRMVLATVQKGFREYTLKNSLVIERIREIPPLALQNSLQQFVKSNGFNPENVILGLPRSEVVERDLRLPIEVEENLERVVQLQVEKFEPSEEERSYYDYLVMDRDEKMGHLTLKIFMVRRAVLDGYLNLFRELKLYPAAVRVDTVGIQQLFQCHQARYHDGKLAAVVELNQNSAQIIFLYGNQRLYSEWLVLGEDGLQAENLIHELARFASRLDLAADGLEKIYLTGSRSEQMEGEFQERLSDCELLTRRLELRRKPGAAARVDSVVKAVGLAISGMNRNPLARLNLIPPEKRLVGERPSLVPTLILAGLVVVASLGLGTRGYSQQKILLNRVDVELEELKPRVDRVLALRNQVEERRLELEELQSLLSGRQTVIRLMKDLTERIPDHTFLQLLQIQNEKVTMQGYSPSASGLLPLLLESPYLEKVENNWITPERSMPGMEKFNFGASVKQNEETVETR